MICGMAVSYTHLMGGQQDCDMHYDMIIKAPTVYLDDTCIIKDGQHIYE